MKRLFLSLLSPLFNERGEVGDNDGTANAGDQGDPQQGDTTGTGEGASSEGSEAPPQESFFDPSQLSPELKKQWSSMHRAYTKKLEGFKQAQDKALAYDRFYSDDDFRLQTLQQAAQQLGYNFSKAQPGNTGQPVASGGESAPADLVERVRSRLDPSLQWMAQSLADAQYEAMRAVIGPREQREEQERARQRHDQYQELAEELSEKVPGWEEHEEEMLELLDFIKSDKMRHKRFGSKLNLLHGIVTGNASAISEATRRMAESAKNRTVSGGISRSSAPNYEDRIRKAKTNQEAFKIAAQEAENFMRSEGLEVP